MSEWNTMTKQITTSGFKKKKKKSFESKMPKKAVIYNGRFSKSVQSTVGDTQLPANTISCL